MSNTDMIIDVLTDEESAELAQHEAVVDEGLATFIAVGRALVTIRDKGLWRVAAHSFGGYLAARYPQLARTEAYRLMDSAAAADTVTNWIQETGEDLPAVDRESHARELAKAPAELQGPAWRDAQALAGGAPVTAEIVAQAVEKQALSDDEWTALKAARTEAHAERWAKRFMSHDYRFKGVSHLDGRLCYLLRDDEGVTSKMDRDGLVELLSDLEARAARAPRFTPWTPEPAPAPPARPAPLTIEERFAQAVVDLAAEPDLAPGWELWHEKAMLHARRPCAIAEKGVLEVSLGMLNAGWGMKQWMEWIRRADEQVANVPPLPDELAAAGWRWETSAAGTWWKLRSDRQHPYRDMYFASSLVLRADYEKAIETARMYETRYPAPLPADEIPPLPAHVLELMAAFCWTLGETRQTTIGIDYELITPSDQRYRKAAQGAEAMLRELTMPTTGVIAEISMQGWAWAGAELVKRAEGWRQVWYFEAGPVRLTVDGGEVDTLLARLRAATAAQGLRTLGDDEIRAAMAFPAGQQPDTSAQRQVFAAEIQASAAARNSADAVENPAGAAPAPYVRPQEAVDDEAAAQALAAAAIPQVAAALAAGNTRAWCWGLWAYPTYVSARPTFADMTALHAYLAKRIVERAAGGEAYFKAAAARKALAALFAEFDLTFEETTA